MGDGKMGIRYRRTRSNGSKITRITRDQPELQVGDFVISIADKSLLKKTPDEQNALWALHRKDGVQPMVVKRPTLEPECDHCEHGMLAGKNLTAMTRLS